MSSFPTIVNFLRREWLTRRIWLVALAVLVVHAMFYETEVRAAWAAFGVACILPLLAIGLAATHDTEADRYWASLGGRPLHRALVRLAGHLGLLAALGLLLLPHLRWSVWIPEDAPVLLPFAPTFVGLAVALVYVSAALTRRSLPVAAALAGPILVGGLLALGVGIDERLGNWTVFEGAGIRMAVLLLAGLTALIRWEGRLPCRTEARGLLLGATGLAALVTAIHAGWTGRPLLLTPSLMDYSADGATALYMPHSAGRGAYRRALLWREGKGLRPVGPAGAFDVELLPDGRLAVFVQGPEGGVWVGDERRMVRCPLPADNRWANHWSTADGAVFLLLGAPKGAVVVRPDGGCERASGPSGALGGFRWESTDHGVVVTPETAPEERDTQVVEEGRLYDLQGDGFLLIGRDLEGNAAGIVPIAGGARAFFFEGPVVDLGPEGERSREALTLVQAVAG